MTKPNPTNRKTCAYPHCRTTIRKARHTNLCEEHQHTPGLCNCNPCRTKNAAAREAERIRQAKRAAASTYKYHPRVISFGDGQTRSGAAVTLPAPAWDISAEATQ